MPADRPTLADYPYHLPLTMRFADNDAYGHVNNVAYYGFFDTAVNQLLIERAGHSLEGSGAINLVIESKCNFHASLAYPGSLRLGVRVDRLGNSAVTWGVAVFDLQDDRAAAHGHVVHVFVDRKTRKPVPIPPRIRAALAMLVKPQT
jgi:acyl-CoA thioester hydrolase